MGTAAFVADEQSYSMCTLAGLATMSGKLAKLEDLRKGIRLSIKETKEAKTSIARWSAALFGAKMLKAACDGAIGILSELTGPAGKVIAGGYQATTNIADAASKAAHGQNVDLVKTGLNVVAGVATAALHNKRTRLDEHSDKSASLEAAANLVNTKKFQSDLVVDAVRKDEKALWDSFKGMMWEMGSMATDAAKGPYSKVLVTVKELAGLHKALKDNIEEFKQDRDTRALDGIVKSFEAQLVKIDEKIGSLQVQLDACRKQQSQQA